MSEEETHEKQTKTVEHDPLDLKIDKVLKIVIAIVVIGAVTWFFFNLFDGWMTEGNPNIQFFELNGTRVNETRAASINFSHLTEQEYNEFPRLRETIEKSQSVKWIDGYRFLSRSKISEQQKGFIFRKGYATEATYIGYLEYQGNYYSFVISLS